MNPNYSIIIPHRNIPILLKRCLSSIPVRDDVQVIVVDDKSDENFLPDLKEVERCFPNVKIIYSDTPGGAGQARNIGLDYAKGKWLLFADADDFFTDILESILVEYIEAEEDILYFRNLSVHSDNIEETSHRDDWLDNIFNLYFKERNDCLIRCNHCAPWGKIIKRALIESNHIRFDEIPFSNDVSFSITSGCVAKHIRIIDRPLYVLTERKGSLTSNFANKPSELEIRALVCFRAIDILRSIDDSYLPYFFYFQWTPSPAKYLCRLFHTDKARYSRLFLASLDVYPSFWDALKKIRIYEKDRIHKFWIYVYSICLLIKKPFQNAI